MKRLDLTSTSARRKTKTAPGAELYSTRAPRKRVVKKESSDSLFAWTIFLLLLIGIAFACWIGSFYVFDHPEHSFSYKLLRKLHKIDPPKRFAPVAAPPGKFYTAESAFKFFTEMPGGKLAELNQDLLQAYLQNYPDKHLLIPYLTGSFSVIGAQALGPKDFITSGYAALAKSTENSKVLIEQFYPAAPEYSDELASMLVQGVEVKLQRTYDLSAVIHIEKLADGRMQFTVIPINYDSYGLGEGRDVRLAPPENFNLKASLPAISGDNLDGIQKTHDAFLAKTAPGVSAGGTPKSSVLARTGPTPDQSVTRVARALPVDGGAALPVPKAVKVTASPSPTPGPIAEATPEPAVEIRKAIAVSSPPPSPVAKALAVAPAATPAGVITSAASSEDKTWKIYTAGQMPRGKLVKVSDIGTLASQDAPLDTTYLQGDFVVKFSGGTRAVLRSSTSDQSRIIVDFLPGTALPVEGSQLNRDSRRPFQITNIRRNENGQINVWVREVTTP